MPIDKRECYRFSAEGHHDCWDWHLPRLLCQGKVMRWHCGHHQQGLHTLLLHRHLPHVPSGAARQLESVTERWVWMMNHFLGWWKALALRARRIAKVDLGRTVFCGVTAPWWIKLLGPPPPKTGIDMLQGKGDICKKTTTKQKDDNVLLLNERLKRLDGGMPCLPCDHWFLMPCPPYDWFTMPCPPQLIFDALPTTVDFWCPA